MITHRLRALVLVAAAFGMLGAAGCSSSGGSKASFCGLFKTYNTKYKNLGDSKSDLNQANAALNSLVSAAPSEIKGDAKTVQKAFAEFVAAGSDPTKLAAAEKDITAKNVTDASSRLDAYTTKNCK